MGPNHNKGVYIVSMGKILKSNKGFSLIELIVVIAILGVLVGVAAPSLIGYVEKTRVSTDISNVENIKRAAEAYVAEHDDVIPTTSSTPITSAVTADQFGGTLPTLKSKNVKDSTISITVDSSGKVTVSPNIDDIKPKTEE